MRRKLKKKKGNKCCVNHIGCGAIKGKLIVKLGVREWEINWYLPQNMDYRRIVRPYVLSKISPLLPRYNRRAYHSPATYRIHWSAYSGDYSTADKTVDRHPCCGVVLFVRPNQTKSSDFSLIFYLVYLQMEEEEEKALLKLLIIVVVLFVNEVCENWRKKKKPNMQMLLAKFRVNSLGE